MTQPIDVTSWLPNLLGPVTFQINGVTVSLPKRLTINFLGAWAITDNPTNNSTDFSFSGGGVSPGGANGDLQVKSGAVLAGLSPGVSGNIVRSNGTAWQSVALSVNLASEVAGLLGSAHGGTGQDFSAATGIVKVASGAMSAAAVDLASADVTGVLPFANMEAPTGTGLGKVSGGAWVGAASLLDDADVDPAAAIALSKLAAGGSDGQVVTQVSGVLALANAPAGGGWVTKANVSFAGASDPGLSANGTYTLAGVTGVKRENAAHDFVAMSVGANGVNIQPDVSAYSPDGATRTAPLLWIPFSSLGITDADLATAMRLLLRIHDSSQTGFDNGHGVIVGIDTDSTDYAAWGRQGTNGGASRMFTAGVWCGSGTHTNRVAGGGMSTGAFVLEVEIPAILKPQMEALVAFRDGVTAWPDLSTLNAVIGQPFNCQPYDGFNPSNVALSSLLGVVIAADSPTSHNDAYSVTISDLRVDTRN